MQERKLNVLLHTFSYAGTSTGSSLCWETAQWITNTALRLNREEKFKDRIEHVGVRSVSDTPVTMVRNEAVQYARQIKADILVMVDADMTPDVHLHDGMDLTARPFIDVAFDKIYEHWDRGPLVIGAPYGGPPPIENTYVFLWEQLGNLGDESHFGIRMYTRNEAQQMAGLHECAALPTGLIAFDMRIFDILEPPYFFYEWKDKYQAEKSSTEDVASTRNMSMTCIDQYGYNPLLCAWSSWAGHNKVWCVKKPNKFGPENVTGTLREALRRPERNDRIIDISQLIDADRFHWGGNGHAKRDEGSPDVRRAGAAGLQPREGGADRAEQNGTQPADGQAPEAEVDVCEADLYTGDE